jgi:hypothetical protein
MVPMCVAIQIPICMWLVAFGVPWWDDKLGNEYFFSLVGAEKGETASDRRISKQSALVGNDFLSRMSYEQHWNWAEEVAPGDDTGKKVSVILMSVSKTQPRSIWLHRSVELLLSEAYSHVVGEVIIVWNDPNTTPPQLPTSARVLRMDRNSLNNRWTHGLNAARFDTILNLDDDFIVTPAAIMCMMHALQLRPKALVGPLVRYFDADGEFSRSPQEGVGLPYRMILPGLAMARKSVFTAYANWSDLYSYIDEQAAHCDDVLLNLALHHDRSEPLRLVLPPLSVGDYGAACTSAAAKTGLSTQGNRRALRVECTRRLLQSLPPPPATAEAGICSAEGLVASFSLSGFDAGAYAASVFLPGCA